MEGMYKYDKFMEAVTKITKLFLIIVVSVMTILVFSQVISRYLIGHTPAYMDELSRYCLIWTSFLGASLAVRLGRHVAVTVVIDRLPNNFRRIVQYFANGAFLFFLVFFLISSYQYAIGQWEQFSPTMGIRITWPALGPVIGTILMIAQFIHTLLSPNTTSKGEGAS